MSLESVTALINELLPEPHAGLLAGLLFGVRANMSRNLYEDLVTTGTLHMVALSGANISILVGLISGTLLSVLHLGKRIVSVLTLIIILGFITFVGPSSTVIRAAIMGCITYLGILAGRQVWPLWSWLVTVVVMIAFAPALMGEVSFQLSAGATLGILLFGQSVDSQDATMDGQGLRRVMATVYALMKEDLRITLSAQVFTLPLIFWHFHRISLISPLPNILIAPVVAPLTGLGYVTVLLGSVWKLPAGWLAWVLWGPLQYMLWVIEFTAKIPYANIGY
jgi:competence protein ComEC